MELSSYVDYCLHRLEPGTTKFPGSLSFGYIFRVCGESITSHDIWSACESIKTLLCCFQDFKRMHQLVLTTVYIQNAGKARVSNANCKRSSASFLIVLKFQISNFERYT